MGADPTLAPDAAPEPATPATPAAPATPARPPGWLEVLTLAIGVVVVVLGAAFLTELLPTDVQRAIFHGPVLIAVLIAGTAFLLWRISRGRPA